MSKKIDYVFKIDGFYDSVNYYRSETPMVLDSMPEPTATGISGLTYADLTAEDGKTYYVRFGAIKGTREKIGDEVAFSTIIRDPMWSGVEFLIYADATTYPSSTFVNQSTKQQVIISGDPKIVSLSIKAPYVDQGSIYFDGNGDVIKVGTYAPVRADFTQEAYVLIPQNPVYGWYPRIFDAYPLMVAATGNGYPQFRLFNSGNPVGSAASLGFETWKHVCLMTKNGIAYFFVGGNLISSSAYDGNVNVVSFGGGVTAGQQFNGYMNCLRVTRGARYSEAGFTPPSIKFPNQ